MDNEVKGGTSFREGIRKGGSSPNDEDAPQNSKKDSAQLDPSWQEDCPSGMKLMFLVI